MSNTFSTGQFSHQQVAAVYILTVFADNAGNWWSGDTNNSEKVESKELAGVLLPELAGVLFPELVGVLFSELAGALFSKLASVLFSELGGVLLSELAFQASSFVVRTKTIKWNA